MSTRPTLVLSLPFKSCNVLRRGISNNRPQADQLQAKTLGKWATPQPAPDLSKWVTPRHEPDLGKWAAPSTSKWAQSPAQNTNQPKRTSSLPDGSMGKWASRPTQARHGSFPLKDLSRSGPKNGPPQSSLPRDGMGKWKVGDKSVGKQAGPSIRVQPDFTQGRSSPRAARPDAGSRVDSSQQWLKGVQSPLKNIGVQKGGARQSPVHTPTDEEVALLEDSGESRRGQSMPRKDAAFKSRGSYRTMQREKIEVEAPAAPKKKAKAKVVKEIQNTMDVFIPTLVTVGNLANLLGVRRDVLHRKMIQTGMPDVGFDHVLTSEYASLLAMEFNRNPVVNDEAAFDIYPPPPHAEPTSLPTRPPVVTIMGHVDHGKTTLLDTLRSSSVAKGEAGGITQHIGAFSVPVSSGGSITFLDTPGHAAFSAMRARGAGVTDIVVLVIAADDGVMPQTKEVIDLVKKDEGKVSLVVAVNKVDKPEADVDKAQKALLAEGVQLEEFGGDVPSVAVSGLTGQGLDKLVDTLSAVAEVMDLRAEKEGRAVGYVLESKVLKGLGPVATVLLLRGTLTPQSSLIAGVAHARVRQLTDSSGKVVKVAYPGTAVTVSGWKELPKAGDQVLQGANDDEVKRALANRKRRIDEANMLQDVEAINERRREEREKKEAGPEAEATSAKAKEDGPKELKLIIKGDVSGSVEAVTGALEGIGNHLAKVKVVHAGVGDVTESDVMYAKAAEGTIVAFSVNTPKSVALVATNNSVPICTSSIIYRLMEDIKARVIALLPVIIEKRVTGEATCLQVFPIHAKGKVAFHVAGCRVSNGTVEKNRKARVIRNGEIIHEGSLETLKHLKKDVTEVRKGMECGIALHKFQDVREGDMIQMFEEIEKPGVL